MLKDEVMAILPKLFDDVGFEKLIIISADSPVYGEWDGKTDTIIEETLRDEFDIIIEDGEISHAKLLKIHDILKPYNHIEMRLFDGHLEIFCIEPASEEKTKKI